MAAVRLSSPSAIVAAGRRRDCSSAPLQSRPTWAAAVLSPAQRQFSPGQESISRGRLGRSGWRGAPVPVVDRHPAVDLARSIRPHTSVTSSRQSVSMTGRTQYRGLARARAVVHTRADYHRGAKRS